MNCFGNKQEKYPKGIPYIVWNCFFDRISSGGYLAILAIYLNQRLLFDTNTATAIFHVNEFFLFLFTIVGAMIAERLGLYKTLTSLSLLCACSIAIIAVASLELPFLPFLAVSFVGLTGAMIGMGCVRSNQNVFGGNQFKGQEEMLDCFFTCYFFVQKSGQVVGMLLMPVLREDFECFGRPDCYPLTYGTIALLMTLGLVILWMGRKVYVHVPLNRGNVVMDVLKCIKHALTMKMKNISNPNTKTHWLDHAEEKFGAKMVKDTKEVLNVLVMYVPMPVYWALLNQQSSRWVFQASRMDGDIGFYTIKPDQMLVLSPISVMILIPLFNKLGFPLLEKIGIKSPLQRVASAMVVVAVSFLLSAYIETQIEQRYISILWIIPQFLLVAISEILQWVANLSFAYTQAPKSMKSVLTSVVYLSIAMGSLIVILISGLRIFSSLVFEFIFYAGLMLVVTVIYSVLAMRYKYVENTISDEGDNENENS